MKRIILSTTALFSIICATAQEPKDTVKSLEPVEVRSTRAAENAPFTKTNLTKKEINKLNLGQDLPFIINQTPSVVVNSDAGNGVGYTGLRIRGTDATRINVTLNGIPYNDAESQGTFFVDLPDFSSSVNSIQIQRGVGTSSNGAGAFGATINISTNEVNKEAYLEFNNAYGSFNTWKNTIRAGSGLVADHFTVDLRVSRITSDGYIDRASSDLSSYYFSTAWMNRKSSLRFNIFSGREKTYQAWNGVSEADLLTNRTINYAGMERNGEPYDNETDNYQQDHYQLFFNHQISNPVSFNTAFFLTRGKGYYEQYKADEAYADYGMPDAINGSETITNTDLVRQLWLDNYYYGNIFSLQYKKPKTLLTLGGAYTVYDGIHAGEVIWAQQGLTQKGNWYDNDAFKNDFSIYAKLQQEIAPHLNAFADIQYRNVNYDLNGFRYNPSITINTKYDFLNPKFGFSYMNNGWFGYASYSRANKEPNRDDFEANDEQQPQPEHLNDFEFGIERKRSNYNISAVLYYMQYKDQLILTGKINDVGAYTRTNIPNSYRAGIEILGSVNFNKWIRAEANLTLSRNKVKDFIEFVDDYDAGGQKQFSYGTTDIAFSPSIISGATVHVYPIANLELSFLSKYVGDQYLDNSSNENRKLDAFFVQDARAIYTLRRGKLKEANLIVQVNNIFNHLYEPNGYTFSYIYGGELVTENYYFPMAGTNFMIGLNLRF